MKGMDPIAAPASEGIAAELRRGRRDNLALLYQGFLTGIVRLQAHRQPLGDPEAFRERMKAALQDVRREATVLGYSSDDIQAAEFAIVAFLDEVILASDEPGRQQWAKQTLAVELYDEAAAGDVFFERLEALRTRQNTQHLADLLEVYVTCLLLGFEGRHAGLKGEIHAAVDWTRRRIDAIRQPEPRLTPEAVPPRRAEAPLEPAFANNSPWFKKWRHVVLITAGVTLAAYLLMFIALRLSAGDIAALVRR